MSGDIVERLGHVTADDEQCRCLKCEAAAEIQRLRRWRAEAAEVIGRWETLVPLGDDTLSPHWLGRSKCVLVAAHIARLTAERAEVERLRAELAAERAECDEQAALVTAWRGVAEALYEAENCNWGAAADAYVALRDGGCPS